ncbi:MAG: hypothetical protein HQK53_13280 [Oligoflexia bacterium]|nr:hypothetical protein [Oligoflexia bacterium]
MKGKFVLGMVRRVVIVLGLFCLVRISLQSAVASWVEPCMDKYQEKIARATFLNHKSGYKNVVPFLQMLSEAEQIRGQNPNNWQEIFFAQVSKELIHRLENDIFDYFKRQSGESDEKSSLYINVMNKFQQDPDGHVRWLIMQLLSLNHDFWFDLICSPRRIYVHREPPEHQSTVADLLISIKGTNFIRLSADALFGATHPSDTKMPSPMKYEHLIELLSVFLIFKDVDSFLAIDKIIENPSTRIDLRNLLIQINGGINSWDTFNQLLSFGKKLPWGDGGKKFKEFVNKYAFKFVAPILHDLPPFCWTEFVSNQIDIFGIDCALALRGHVLKMGIVSTPQEFLELMKMTNPYFNIALNKELAQETQNILAHFFFDYAPPSPQQVLVLLEQIKPLGIEAITAIQNNLNDDRFLRHKSGWSVEQQIEIMLAIDRRLFQLERPVAERITLREQAINSGLIRNLGDFQRHILIPINEAPWDKGGRAVNEFAKNYVVNFLSSALQDVPSSQWAEILDNNAGNFWVDYYVTQRKNLLTRGVVKNPQDFLDLMKTSLVDPSDFFKTELAKAIVENIGFFFSCQMAPSYLQLGKLLIMIEPAGVQKIDDLKRYILSNSLWANYNRWSPEQQIAFIRWVLFLSNRRANLKEELVEKVVIPNLATMVSRDDVRLYELEQLSGLVREYRLENIYNLPFAEIINHLRSLVPSMIEQKMRRDLDLDIHGDLFSGSGDRKLSLATHPLSGLCDCCMNEPATVGCMGKGKDNGDGACNIKYCKSCFQRSIRMQTREHHFPLTCDGCKAEIVLSRDDFSFSDRENTYQKIIQGTLENYHRKRFLENISAITCPTPECGNRILLTEEAGEVDSHTNHYTCSVCHYKRCRTCAVDHRGESCADFVAHSQKRRQAEMEAERSFQQALHDPANRIIRPCPYCHTPCGKDNQCSHVTCSNPSCGRKFDYVVGRLDLTHTYPHWSNWGGVFPTFEPMPPRTYRIPGDYDPHTGGVYTEYQHNVHE